MKLAGLLSAALADPALAHTQKLTRLASGDQVEITAPPALRPFLVALLAGPLNGAAAPGGAGRAAGATAGSGGTGGPAAVLAVTATSREADDLAAALGGLIARTRSRSTRPGRRCRTSGSRPAPTRSAGGWRCCAGWPTRRRAPVRCGSSWRRSGRCCSRSSTGSATWSRSSCAPGGSRPRRGRRQADRHRVRPGRPGHQAGRVRRARRHPRRLPAHRRAPVAGRVLGRRGRGDPHLRRRRPAHHRAGGPALGAALPGAAAHRRGPGQGAALLTDHPELAEMLDKLAEGIPVEGMESLAPALLGERPADRPDRSLELLLDCMPAGTTCCSATRSGSAPGRTTWCVPARSSSRRAGPRRPSAARPRSTSAPPPSGPWPRYAPSRRASASPGGR